MSDKKQKTWDSAMERRGLALKVVSAAKRLHDSGGPDEKQAWELLVKAREVLGRAEHAESGSFHAYAEVRAKQLELGVAAPDAERPDDQPPTRSPRGRAH